MASRRAGCIACVSGGHDVVSIGKLHFRSASDDTGFSDRILPMYLANQGMGWPQSLQRKPLGSFPGAAEMASLLGPGETSYTRYDRDITAAAVDWLRQRRPTASKPWVLYVSLVSPHFPLSAPQRFYDLYQGETLPEPWNTNPADQVEHPVIDAMRGFWNYAEHFDQESERIGLKNYYGLCSFLDDNVARILDALELSGQAEDTLVIYTSDHGDMLGNHGIWGKCFMYEDSVGVPLVMCGPGIESSINVTPVSLIDLAATVEQAVRGESVAAAEPWNSRPLQDFLVHPEPDRAVLSEYHDGGSPCGSYMLRQGRWKYVYFPEGHPALLFDMENDPRELENLIDREDMAGTVESLRTQLFRIMDPETVNRQAFADQDAMIASLGGMEAILSMPSFNHTPIG